MQPREDISCLAPHTPSRRPRVKTIPTKPIMALGLKCPTFEGSERSYRNPGQNPVEISGYVNTYKYSYISIST